MQLLVLRKWLKSKQYQQRERKEGGRDRGKKREMRDRDARWEGRMSYPDERKGFTF